jgi:hypothetical protein
MILESFALPAAEYWAAADVREKEEEEANSSLRTMATKTAVLVDVSESTDAESSASASVTAGTDSAKSNVFVVAADVVADRNG